MAGVLRDQVRAHELVGRVGGEEFALLLPGATGDDAYEVAERCRAALSALLVHGVAVSCSAGVASYPSDGPDGARLLELADGALYWAKRSGRAQTKRYHPGEVVLLSSAEQRAQVQEVLAREDAMQPVFQPIVELATGRIAGYEALARFVHAQPVRTPDLWFAQARRCGLGPALEARALEVALAVQGRPAGTFLSLNVSPGALISAEVRAALPEDLSDIVIELTEDEVFSSDNALDAELAALRARGAKIAVDDAGAGYAGLQQLIRVKPEILKIDRSLISGVDEDSSKIALLEALTSFASSTGAAVCGEGIETLAELRMLARFDTTYAQGYALGRPGPAWSEGAADMAADTTAEVSMGMRLTRTAVDGDEGSLTPGEVAERLSRIRSQSELTDAIEMMRRLLHSDVVVVSRVRIDERRVETLSHNDWSPTERFYSYADFPTTGHVLEQQVLGQVISGDPAADPAELELLEGSGLHALLMAPILHRGETVGLLEICRREPRPWTGREIDRARLLAHSLGMAIRFEGREPLPWPTEALHIPAPTSGD
jgi:EAL domain-containing protein (putative c-di-GMP-specific phosphodiesterase class I)